MATLPSQVGATRSGGIDLNRPRMRQRWLPQRPWSLRPDGFSVADFAAGVQAMTGREGYTIRQAAYDLRKLRGKNLAVKPGTSRRYQIPPRPSASSRRSSPCATTSSRRSSPESAVPAQAQTRPPDTRR